MIDKDSSTPIYVQIEEHIRSLIQNQDLKPGDAIPSERDFTEQFKVSRMTVRQAIFNLVNEGTLVRLKGKGTFIAQPKIEQPLQGLTSFTEDMKKRGLTPSNKLLEFHLIPAPVDIADDLAIQEHDPIYEINRIRLADQVPMAVEKVYLSANLVKGLTEEIVNQSLYYYIENQLGMEMGSATQVLEAASAKEEEAEHLNIPAHSPVLIVDRITYLVGGTPLEVVHSIFRGDRYKFTINMSRSQD